MSHIWVIESKDSQGWKPTAYSFWSRQMARHRFKAIREREPLMGLRIVKYGRVDRAPQGS